jgi:peptidoglycan/LPS O-acetylase OafA/YrhL
MIEAAPVRRQNPWLNLVRGLAIIFVLLRHGEKSLSEAGLAAGGIFHTIMMNGWIGVDLFFVLSGYLITSHLLRERERETGIRMLRYLTQRALRILPAYFAVLALIVAGAFPYFAVDPAHLGVRIAYHLLLLQDYLPSNINVVFWSLGVEEKFYLLAPLAVAGFMALRTPSRAGMVVLALLVIVSLLRLIQFESRPLWDYVSFFQELRSPFHMSLEPLLAGLAIAYARHMKLLTGLPRSPVLLMAVFAVLLGFMASHQFMAEITLADVVLQPALISLLCAGLVATAVGLAFTPLPGASLARVTARLSYCLYLVHFPLLPAAQAWAGGSALLFWAIYLSLSIAVAWLVHRLVERPFLEIKDRLARTSGNGIPRPVPSI